MFPVHEQPIETEDRLNSVLVFTCPCCEGEGVHEVLGARYADYAGFPPQPCIQCGGTGKVVTDYTACDPRAMWDEIDEPQWVEDPSDELLMSLG